MSKKLFCLISVVLLLSLAAPATASHPDLPDVLLASYEDGEVGDLTTGKPEDASLTITRVTGGGDIPPATDGSKILKLVWDEPEPDRKFVVEHSWSSSLFNFEPYNLIKADVWFDDANSQPRTMGIWNDSPGFWAPALSVPQGIRQWHTVELDIRVIDYNNIDHLFAFVFESLAGDAGVIYMDNMRLVQAPLVQAWRPIPFDKAVSQDPNVDLSWTAGIDANSHDVYIGTSFADVNSGTGGTFKGNQALADTNYDPGTLELSKTYYWRIDEVNVGDGNSPWKGNIWSFKTDPTLGYVEIPLVSYEDSENANYDPYIITGPGGIIAGDDFSLKMGDSLTQGSTWTVAGVGVSVPNATRRHRGVWSEVD